MDTNKSVKNGKKFQKYAIGIFVLWLIYTVLSVYAPARQAITQYKISLFELNMLRATVLLPYLLFWLAAVFAVVQFREYTRLIEGSPEVQGFRQIIRGLFGLMLVIIVPTFVNLLLSYYPLSLSVQRFVTIVNNYIVVGLYLFSFANLWLASCNLQSKLQTQPPPFKFKILLFLGLVVISFIYFWVVFHNPYRSSSPDILIRPTYFLPDIPIVLTVMIPYILVWLFGGLAVGNLLSFARQVKGVIYTKALWNTVNGLVTIIVLTIGLQFLSQLIGFFRNASLGIILLVIYIILFIIAVGYLSIAKGAHRLSEIEQV